jgi:hypothetical protein
VAQGNGVFVKLFRNLEEWQKREVELGKAQSKFEFEEKRRLELGKELGFSEEDMKVPANSEINPADFYPNFDDQSDEFRIWHNGSFESQLMVVDIAQIRKSNSCFAFPIEVLEELAIAQRNKIFGVIKWFCPGSGDFADWYYLYRGYRGNQCYLIAYWGSKEIYDKIQQDLHELADKRKKEALAKQAAAVSPEVKKIRDANLPKTEDISLAWFIVGALSMAALLYVWVAKVEDNWR